ncbi:11-oxo-beta-amyrin 30-oxidase, partial [Bienertia sinuspersici]
MKVSDFQKTIPNPILKRITNGLTRHEGQKWVQQRKLINPAFHMEKLKHMVPAFHASCNEMIQEWEKMTSKTGSSEVEMWSFLHNFSADAISRAAFGNMIQKRQKAMEEGEEAKDDLLGLLLKSNKEGIEQDHHEHGNSHNKQHVHVKMSLKEVIEECKTFYIAGQETTSTLLVWTLLLLSKHPNWQEQLREEIFATFGHNTPDSDGLNQLKKVNMVLHEVLRLYPPAPSLIRKLCNKMKVGDTILPEGVQVNLSLAHVHQNEKYWGSDAKEFNPERFSQGILQATFGNMCFFAFGWGP